MNPTGAGFRARKRLLPGWSTQQDKGSVRTGDGTGRADSALEGLGCQGTDRSRGASGSRESVPVLMSASLFIRLERAEPFGRLVESRLKILAGVRGNSDMVRPSKVRRRGILNSRC